MKIVICDDEPVFVAKLNGMLTRYLSNAGIEHSILPFYGGEELLRHEGDIDLLFLDINLANMNGIDIAFELRKERPDFVLVFISSYMEYAPHGYEVQAFRYLLKSKLSTSFKACIDAVLFHFGFNRHKMEFSFVEGTYELYADRILYLESQKHTVLFHISDGRAPVLKLYSTLDKLQEVLPADEFLRIHKSYLLNMRYLDNILNYTAYLSNGTTLPVSQKNFASAKREFFHYKGKKP